MSYAYSQIFNALDPNQQQQQQTQAMSTQQSGVSPNAAGQSGSMQAQKQANPSAAAQQTAFNKNVAKAKSPVNLGQVSNQIAANKQNLQNEANSYVQSQAAPFKGVTNEEDYAAQQMAGTGKEQTAGQAQALQQKILQGPGMADAFRPKEMQTNREAEMLRNNAGIMDLLRQRSDPEATQGEIGYGAALLGKNKEFQEGRQKLLSEQKGLQQYQEELPYKAEQEAQAARESAYGDWRNQIGSVFGRELGKVEGLAREREKSAHQRSEESAYNNAVLNSQRARDATAELAASSPELAPYLSEVGAGGYAQNMAQPLGQTNWQQFLGAGEGSKYNNIMALLGKGPVQGAGMYEGYSPQMGNFDRNKFIQDLKVSAKAKMPFQESKPLDVLNRSDGAAQNADAGSSKNQDLLSSLQTRGFRGAEKLAQGTKDVFGISKENRTTSIARKLKP